MMQSLSLCEERCPGKNYSRNNTNITILVSILERKHEAELNSLGKQP